jgi:hypothetical protein
MVFDELLLVGDMSNKNAKKSEIRSDHRNVIKQDSFPGQLICKKTGTVFVIKPTDVSLRGLGFMANQNLEPGAYWLKFENKKISVELIYSESHLGIDNLFRCGLFVRDPDEDLRLTFEALGLLQQ